MLDKTVSSREQNSMSPPPIPPKIKALDSDTLTPVSSRYTELKLGNALATVDEEVIIQEVYITNAAGETLVGYRRTVTMTDDTDGTEDTVVKEYALTNGALVEI